MDPVRPMSTLAATSASQLRIILDWLTGDRECLLRDVTAADERRAAIKNRPSSLQNPADAYTEGYFTAATEIYGTQAQMLLIRIGELRELAERLEAAAVIADTPVPVLPSKTFKRIN